MSRLLRVHSTISYSITGLPPQMSPEAARPHLFGDTANIPFRFTANALPTTPPRTMLTTESQNVQMSPAKSDGGLQESASSRPINLAAPRRVQKIRERQVSGRIGRVDNVEERSDLTSSDNARQPVVPATMQSNHYTLNMGTAPEPETLPHILMR